MMRLGLTVTVALSLSLASVASANIYGGPGGAIPDAPANGTPGVATFLITVGDAGQVGSFNGLTLSGLAHTFLGDLTATLTAPDGTVVTIFDRVGKTSPDSGFGDSSNFLGTYVFKDGGAGLWAAAAAVNGATVVANGNYSASAALTGAAISLQAALAGHSVTGDWKLTIADYGVGESGTLGNWQLDFSVVPAPGVLATLALGVLGARRRRA